MKLIRCPRCERQAAYVLASEPQGEMFICTSCGEAGIVANDGACGDEHWDTAENED